MSSEPGRSRRDLCGGGSGAVVGGTCVPPLGAPSGPLGALATLDAVPAPATSPARHHAAWLAPTAGSPLDATVVVPGSKSLTNRYLVLAALADGPVTLRGALRSRDTTLMADALRALGAGVDD